MATQKLSTRASISLQMMEQVAPSEETFEAFAIVQPFSIRRKSASQKLSSAQVAVIVEAAKGKDIRRLLKSAKATRVEHIVDDFYSAVVPFENAKLIYEHADVTYVEAQKQKKRLLEKALIEGGVGLPAKRSVDVEGDGVVVGVIDSGFDLSHPAFRDDKGELRVDALLVQSFNEASQTFSEREFTTKQLETGWKNGSNPGFDEDGHGTHVASIAAGSPFNAMSGVAPKARLVLVKTDFIRLSEATKWCFDKAGTRPIAVNMSLGGHHGGHDGFSREERTLEQLSGPGRIIVLAAGNERQDSIHVGSRFSAGQTEVVLMDVSTRERSDTIVCWFDDKDDFEVSVISPSGTEMVAPASNASNNFSANGARLSLGRKAQPMHKSVEILVSIRFLAGADISDFRGWKFRVKCKKAALGRFDAWLTGNSQFRENKFVETARTIGMPATARNVIAVASHVTKNKWQSDEGARTSPGAVVGRSSVFSSKGPTRDGREKPEVSAPGEMITAALAAKSESAGESERANTADRTLTIEGTSMATPYVTGVIALMLQHRPTLGPADALGVIRETARKDEHTGPSVWTPEYGHGKLSALDAVNRVRQMGASTVVPVGPASVGRVTGAAPSAAPVVRRGRAANKRSRGVAKRKG